MARKKERNPLCRKYARVPGSRLWDDAGHAIHAVG